MPAVITTAMAPFTLALLTMSPIGAGEPYGVYWPSPRHFIWGEVLSQRELLDRGRIQTEILTFRPDEPATFDGVPAHTIRYQVIVDCPSREVTATSHEFYDDTAALLFRATFLEEHRPQIPALSGAAEILCDSEMGIVFQTERQEFPFESIKDFVATSVKVLGEAGQP